MAYQWWVFLHVVGAFGFVMSHGVSVTVAFRMRKERDRAKIQELKALSGSAITGMYISLGLLLAFGIIAGFAGHWWHYWWIWAALAILIVLVAEMSAVSRPYYEKVIEATQMRDSGVPRKSDEELDQLLKSPLPMINAAIGFAGLLVIIWLMIFKPGT
jgi:NADH:ubiquinone oxidoreductase subunit 2 (subunit N)